MFPFTRYFPMDCWQSFKASISQSTFFFLFFYFFGIAVHSHLWKHTVFHSYKLLQALIKLCKKSCLQLCTQLSAAFFTLQRMLGRLFQTFLTLHSKANVKLCPKFLFKPQSSGTDSRQTFLTCKGMAAASWNEPLALHALLCTHFCCSTFWLAWEELFHSPNKTFCPCRNKAGWLDSELNMFTHQYLQQSR